MKRLLFIISTVFIANTALAQTLTLDECRQAAIDNNKQVAKSKVEQEKSDHTVSLYKTNFLPKFNIVAADLYSFGKGNFTIKGGHLPIYSYNEAAGQFVPDVTMNADGSYTLNQYADFPDKTMKLKVENVFTAGVMFEQPIYMGGKITAAYNMSKIGHRIAGLNIRKTESEVLVATDEAYTMVVRAKEMVKVAEAYQAMLGELYKNVESAYRHGMRTRNDVLKVQVKQNEVELSIQKAQNAVRLAKMNLCYFIGKPLDSAIDVAGVEIKTDTDDAYVADATHILNRPEYEMLNQKMELAHEQVKLTKSDYMPTVALIGGYTYINGLKVDGNRLIDNGAASAMITFKFPVFHFGEGSHKVKIAKAEERLAMLDRDDLNNKMMLELTQAANNLNEAISEVKMTAKSLEQAAENVRTSKKQFDVGYETLTDHLEAQSLWQKAYADDVEARCNLFLMKSRYMKAAGMIF